MPDIPNPLVAIAMGSRSDWPTMEKASLRLVRLGVRHECRITSAHRTPDRVKKLAEEAMTGYFKIIIAGAGGAAHLPGMLAAYAPSVPVLGVPIQSRALQGLDSLLSIVQMPAGVPVATFAIGEAGAEDAAIFATQILAAYHPEYHARLLEYRMELAASVPATPYDQPAPAGGAA